MVKMSYILEDRKLVKLEVTESTHRRKAELRMSDEKRSESGLDGRAVVYTSRQSSRYYPRSVTAQTQSRTGKGRGEGPRGKKGDQLTILTGGKDGRQPVSLGVLSDVNSDSAA